MRRSSPLRDRWRAGLAVPEPWGWIWSAWLTMYAVAGAAFVNGPSAHDWLVIVPLLPLSRVRLSERDDVLTRPAGGGIAPLAPAAVALREWSGLAFAVGGLTRFALPPHGTGAASEWFVTAAALFAATSVPALVALWRAERVRVTPAGVTVPARWGERDIAWSSVAAVTEDGDHVHLVLDTGERIRVPRGRVGAVAWCDGLDYWRRHAEYRDDLTDGRADAWLRHGHVPEQ